MSAARWAVAFAGAAICAGCGGGNHAKAPPRHTATKAPPAFGDAIQLQDGRTYTTTRFKPALRITIPKTGVWKSEIGDSPQHLSVAWGKPTLALAQAILAAHRIDKVFDPRRGGKIPGDEVSLKGDFVAWLHRHPHLRTTAPRAVHMLGLSGEMVDIGTRSSPPRLPYACAQNGDRCVPLFFDGLDYVLYSDTTRGRFIALGLPDGGELVLEEFIQPATGFKKGLRVLSPLLTHLALAAS
jgi:hypothetical protein